MKNYYLLFISFCCFTSSVFAQNKSTFNKERISTIEKTLSADDMEGRKTFTPGIDKAANFIASEFEKIGLSHYDTLSTYFQKFFYTKTKFISAEGLLNGNLTTADKIIAFTDDDLLNINETAGYNLKTIDSSKDLIAQAKDIISQKIKTIVFVPVSKQGDFNKLKRLKGRNTQYAPPVIFVLSNVIPSSYSFIVKQEVTKLPLQNVIGIIPGKSKKNEYVVFSGHYDHLGIGKPNAAGDSIYNGANDDAAGTTAVIALADHFKKLNNNERTLVFVAFTAEEIGGFGSQYFSTHINPDEVVAMFNIEMIGTDSKWGKNSAYITGDEKSDFGKILQKNLEGTDFNFYPDPYTSQNLFYRSDNATLAALGVPAHTISTSQMDQDKTYHTLGDEHRTLDIENMVAIIEAIAKSSVGIVSGKDTPVRIEKLEK